MDTKQLEDAIVRLKEMLQEYENSDKLEPLLKDAVKESLIQRFEYTHEMAWKTAKKFLVEIEGYKSDIGPNSVIRVCGELELLDAEKWLEYGTARQSTSHDYSGLKATVTLDAVEDFSRDAKRFLSILQKRLIRKNNGK